MHITQLALTCAYLYKQLQWDRCWKYTDYSHNWYKHDDFNGTDRFNGARLVNASRSPLGRHMRSLTLTQEPTSSMLHALARFTHLQSLFLLGRLDVKADIACWSEACEALSPTLVKLHLDVDSSTDWSCLTPLLQECHPLTRLEELVMPPGCLLHDFNAVRWTPNLRRLVAINIQESDIENIHRIASTCTHPLELGSYVDNMDVRKLVTLSQAQGQAEGSIPNFSHLHLEVENDPYQDNNFHLLQHFTHLTSLNIDTIVCLYDELAAVGWVSLPSLTHLRMESELWCEDILKWLREWTSPHHLPSLRSLGPVSC